MENAGTTASKKAFALIGGIASGKTAVSDIFAKLGAYIIDADVISHNITAKGSEGEAMLKKNFPDCVTNGTLDRRALKEKVFNDDKALKKLNKLTHPLIMAQIEAELKNAPCTAIVVMPTPLKLERFYGVINVYAPMDMRIERVTKRDNITVDLAQKIIAAQFSDVKAASLSDYTFVNDGSYDDLKRAVTKWWEIFGK